MSTAATVATPAYEWRDLYLQALFESDHTKIKARIREAERVLVHREHELFTIPMSASEREAIISALNSLYVLSVCLGPDTSAAAA